MRGKSTQQTNTLRRSSYSWEGLDQLPKKRNKGERVELGVNLTQGTSAEKIGSSYPVLDSPLIITDLNTRFKRGRWCVSLMRMPGTSFDKNGKEFFQGPNGTNAAYYYTWVEWLEKTGLSGKSFASQLEAEEALRQKLDNNEIAFPDF